MEKISVVPNEKDFVDAIVSLNEHQRRGLPVHKGNIINHIRQSYVRKVILAETCFWGKLCTAFDEFPCISQTDPSYTDLLLPPNCIYQCSRAQGQVFSAAQMIQEISREYQQLLKKDGDSLDKCKRLKVAAFGCIFTVAKRSLPSLNYLYKVRQLMAAKSLEDDENADATLTNNKFHILTREYCPLPLPVSVRSAADCVEPETFYWLDQMEREHGLRLEDDQVGVAKLAHKLEDHLALPLAA